MNKAQIKAELRSVACGKERAWDSISDLSFIAAVQFRDKDRGENLALIADDYLRTFFLLVAEAL